MSSSSYLYRIMPFRYLVGLLETRELFFASPNSWDDPYERVLQHKGSSFAFAQCWCKRAVSDAMWRIYSTDRTAVRIRTSRSTLESVGVRIKATFDATYRVADVRYASAKAIDEELDEIAGSLRLKFGMKRATDALFLKRDAFDYEAEVRAVAYLQPRKGLPPPSDFRIRIDPHQLVESVLFDPRAEETYVKVSSHYLKRVLGFSGSVGRSALYKASSISVADDEA